MVMLTVGDKFSNIWLNVAIAICKTAAKYSYVIHTLKYDFFSGIKGSVCS
jgi:hypothetical protein